MPSPPASPEGVFEDEAPGAYLSELGTRTASIIWGAVTLAGTVAIGTLAAAGSIPHRSDWRLLAEVAWALFPLSASILLIITLWQAGTGYTKTAPGKALASLLLGAATLVLWLVFRAGFGVFG